MKFGGAKIDPFIAFEIETDAKKAPVAQKPRELNEFEAIATSVADQPRDGISCLLGLVQPPRWMAGAWADRKEGWFDTRTGTLLTFADARQLIEDRIKELDLDRELVYAWPHSHGTFAASGAFWHQEFSVRMNAFRRKEFPC